MGRADKGQPGKLGLAQGGTLYLDRVSKMPVEIKEKLLRVIEEKEYYRVGGVKRVKADVRIICGSSVDLESRVKQGRFHKDLFYWLKAGYLSISPLRQRKEDIIPLANAFLQDYSHRQGKGFKRVGKQAAKILQTYDWPGNERELKNVVEYAVLMYDDSELKPSHLGDLIKTAEGKINGVSLEMPEPLPDTGISLEEYIGRCVYQVLEKHGGNKTKAARYLGISRPSLYKYLRSLELE